MKEEKERILCVAWKCFDCKSILGYTNASRDQLRIKYKDLYVFIKGGSTTVICRHCGCQNSVSYNE